MLQNCHSTKGSFGWRSQKAKKFFSKVGNMNDVPLLTIPYRKVAAITAFLPFAALVFCLSYSFFFHYDFSTNTHCNVWNFAPSISASIGILRPQRHVWKLSMALHSAPRFLTAALYYKVLLRGYFTQGTGNRQAGIIRAAFLTNTLENLSLLMLSFAPSAGEDAFIHRASFGIFLVCSLLYMELVYKIQTKMPWKKIKTRDEVKSLGLKRNLQLANGFCTLTAMYLFYRHNQYCEPGIYSLFSIFEYIIVVTNIGYHLTSYLDFYHYEIKI